MLRKEESLGLYTEGKYVTTWIMMNPLTRDGIHVCLEDMWGIYMGSYFLGLPGAKVGAEL